MVTFEEGEIGVPYKKEQVVPESTMGSNVTAPNETACSKPPTTNAVLLSQALVSQPQQVTNEMPAGMNIHKATANPGGSVPVVAKVETRRVALTTLNNTTALKTTG